MDCPTSLDKYGLWIATSPGTADCREYINGLFAWQIIHPTRLPTAYSLLPTPDSLLPTPYSLLPSPYSLVMANTLAIWWAFESYRLYYPNYEVKSAFLKYLLASFSHFANGQATNYLSQLVGALRKKELERFFAVLEVFFANIPYSLQIKTERYYHSIFYMIFKLIGLSIHAEVETNQGRIDAVIELPSRVVIFEFKVDGSADKALEQAKKTNYYQKYGQSEKTAHLENGPHPLPPLPTLGEGGNLPPLPKLGEGGWGGEGRPLCDFFRLAKYEFSGRETACPLGIEVVGVNFDSKKRMVDSWKSETIESK